VHWTKEWSALKAWGGRLIKRIRMKKAKVAIARIPAVETAWVGSWWITSHSDIRPPSTAALETDAAGLLSGRPDVLFDSVVGEAIGGTRDSISEYAALAYSSDDSAWFAPP
jgi:hypothetical protein